MTGELLFAYGYSPLEVAEILRKCEEGLTAEFSHKMISAVNTRGIELKMEALLREHAPKLRGKELSVVATVYENGAVGLTVSGEKPVAAPAADGLQAGAAAITPRDSAVQVIESDGEI